MGTDLHKNQILSLLQTRWLGKTYRYFPEIGSTNTALLAQSQTDALPNGTVFLTDYQIEGKGRLGRRWVAPRSSSLLYSVLFKPEWNGAERIMWLTMIGCLAVIEAVSALTAVSPKIKWPNDIVIEQNNAWRKTGGILVEGSFNPDGVLERAVLGTGINVNISQKELPNAHTPATSIMLAHGAPVDRATLFCHILKNLEARYDRILSGKSPFADWEAELVTLGQQVVVSQVGREKSLEGVAEGVTTYGHLLVRDTQNRLHTVQAGDVSLRKVLKV